MPGAVNDDTTEVEERALAEMPRRGRRRRPARRVAPAGSASRRKSTGWRAGSRRRPTPADTKIASGSLARNRSCNHVAKPHRRLSRRSCSTAAVLGVLHAHLSNISCITRCIALVPAWSGAHLASGRAGADVEVAQLALGGRGAEVVHEQGVLEHHLHDVAWPPLMGLQQAGGTRACMPEPLPRRPC